MDYSEKISSFWEGLHLEHEVCSAGTASCKNKLWLKGENSAIATLKNNLGI